MSKELYMMAHEQLINEYLDEHPCADEQEAYMATADRAYDRYREMYADLADHARMKQKYGEH